MSYKHGRINSLGSTIEAAEVAADVATQAELDAVATAASSALATHAALEVGAAHAISQVFVRNVTSGTPSVNAAIGAPAAGDFGGQKWITFRWVANTTLRIYMRGDDNAVKSVDLTLA